MPHQNYTCQFREGLGDVEVTKRADLEEGDAQTLCKGLSVFSRHLTLVGQVQAVPHQDLWDSWCMLIKKTLMFKLFGTSEFSVSYSVLQYQQKSQSQIFTFSPFSDILT